MRQKFVIGNWKMHNNTSEASHQAAICQTQTPVELA